MVKGITRRVVMIKSPDPQIFDEAIFIVRDEGARKPGVTYEEILREAQNVAENYVRSKKETGTLKKLPPLLYTLIGAGAVGLVWLISALI